VSRGPFAEARVSFLFPCYNEEGTIAEVVREAWAVAQQLHPSCEILALDDGSRDRTLEVLQGLTEEVPALRVLRHERNQGLFATFQDLFHAAACPWVFLNGADGQWAAAELLRLLAARDERDVVVGVRRVKRYSAQRQVVSWAFNFLTWLLFGVETRDAGSVKLMRREVARLPLVSTSPFGQAERLIRAVAAGYQVGFSEVEHRDRTAGKATGASWKNIRGSLADMARVWWELGRVGGSAQRPRRS